MNHKRFTLAALTMALSAFLAASFPQALQAQDDFKPQYRPTLHVSKIAGGPIVVDGTLNEPAWQQAARAEGFVETEPGDQIKPPVESRVLVTYDDNNLYLGFIAYDDPRTVRYSVRDRDNIFRDDYFGIMLDTYGDASWAYEFYANPIGMQGDMRMLTNSDEDMSFDLVWESKGMVTDSGYQIEMAIPFASLRFPNRAEQVWKVNFWRDRQRDVRRQFSWAALTRGDGCFLCQWGTLTGISGIKPGSRLEILPNIVASQAGQLRNSAEPDAGFVNDDVEAQVSLNARYGLSSNTSAELAVNPDFSQVESDATQIDVNSPLALLYEERRPFFQEGSDLFRTWINAIHTRSIADPQVASKLSGRLGHTGFTYLLGRDEHTPILVPTAERTYIWRGGKSITNIARARHPLWNDSYIGGLITDRRLDGGGAGSLIGADGSFRFLTKYRFDFQTLFSRTEEPTDPGLTASAGDDRFERGRHSVAFDGERYWGHGLFLGLVRDGRVWNSSILYGEDAPTFRADNGFLPNNDDRYYEVSSSLTFYSTSKLFQQAVPAARWGRLWDFGGLLQEQWLRPSVSAVFTGQTTVTAEMLFGQERYHDIWFGSIRNINLILDSRPTESFTFNIETTLGDQIARNIATPVLGRGRDFSVSTTIEPTKRFAIEPQITYSSLDYPDDGANIFTVYVARTRLNYQFTREFSMRLVTEYVHSKDATGVPGEYDKQATLSVEPLFSYKLNPFTVIYLGSTHDYWDADRAGRLYRSSQRFFAKFQYLIRR